MTTRKLIFPTILIALFVSATSLGSLGDTIHTKTEAFFKSSGLNSPHTGDVFTATDIEKHIAALDSKDINLINNLRLPGTPSIVCSLKSESQPDEKNPKKVIAQQKNLYIVPKTTKNGDFKVFVNQFTGTMLGPIFASKIASAVDYRFPSMTVPIPKGKLTTQPTELSIHSTREGLSISPLGGPDKVDRAKRCIKPLLSYYRCNTNNYLTFQPDQKTFVVAYATANLEHYPDPDSAIFNSDQRTNTLERDSNLVIIRDLGDRYAVLIEGIGETENPKSISDLKWGNSFAQGACEGKYAATAKLLDAQKNPILKFDSGLSDKNGGAE